MKSVEVKTGNVLITGERLERILKTLITDAVIKASVIGNAKIKFSSRRIEVKSRL